MPVLGETANLFATACAILEEVAYICNLCGLQVLFHTINNDKEKAKLEKNSQEGQRDSNGLW